MTVLRFTHRLLMASAAIALVAPDVVLAQQPEDPNVTVTGRSRPEYDPLGIRAGSFIIFPEIGVTESYSDNVALDEDDEQSDFVTQIEPLVELQSQWSRHALGLEVGADIAFHAEESDEDYQDFFALGQGLLDISRQTNLSANTELRLAHEGRDDPEDPGDDELTNVYIFGGGLALEHQINRLGFTVGGDVQRNVYEDDEEDRNANIYDFLLRTSYEVSPRLDTFVEGRYNIEDRDDDVDANGIERDTNGYEARLGVGLDITSVLFGEAFAGYRLQQFAEDDFDDETGVSFGVDLNWNPTQLTSIGFSGARDFRPTDEGGAASNFRTDFGITIDHEFLRNVIVGGRANYRIDDFRGDDREDETYILGGGITYWLNRNLSLNAGYDYSERDSNQAGEDYRANTFSIGLTARL